MTLPLRPTGEVVGIRASRTFVHHNVNGDSESEGEQKVPVEDTRGINEHSGVFVDDMQFAAFCFCASGGLSALEKDSIFPNF